MNEANKTQVGGKHYSENAAALQHWDIVAQNQLDYFQGQITKYVMRWKLKNGLQDLLKAQHFLEKYIELIEAGVYERKPTDPAVTARNYADPNLMSLKTDLCEPRNDYVDQG